MLLRKFNAVLSLLATLLLLDHSIFTSVWMLSRGSIQQSAPFAPRALMGVMVLHAFVSIDLAISAHMEGEKRKCKSYPKMNRATIVQRISGVLLLVFAALHVAGTTGALQPPHLVHTILPPIFFAIALAHTAVSVDKAFITLGIGNARFAKAVSIIIKVICAATLIAGVVGFYLYVW